MPDTLPLPDSDVTPSEPGFFDHPHRVKAARSPEDRARHAAIREEFAGKPDFPELLATGEYDGPFQQGDVLAGRGGESAAPATPEPPAVPPAEPPPADPAPDRLRRIFAIAARVRDRRARYEDAASTARAAKKALEAEQEEHEALHSELEREAAAAHESLPLFPDDAAAPAPPAAESWRPTPLADLGLPPAIVETLAEAELTTFGQLADWTAASKALTDIPGIGPAKAEKVEESLFAYWSGRVAPVEFTAIQPPPDPPPANAEADPVAD